MRSFFSLSLLCLALIALICLRPLSVKAGDKKEHGTVIGIGAWQSSLVSSQWMTRCFPDLGTT